MTLKKAFFVHDTVVKIILKEESASGATSDTVKADSSKLDSLRSETTATKSDDNQTFFVHKALLSSLSPELDKHTNNDMKEGREGVLALSDVDGPTMEAFMEWAYFKDYTVDVPESWGTVLPHTKVYVLADRFNITILQDLAYSKIDSLFKSLKTIVHNADIAALMEAVAYAYDNLLFRSTALIKPGASDSKFDPRDDKIEKLLKYFAQYSAWSLEKFRRDPGFRKLVSTCAEFSEALIISSGPATIPPWVTNQVQGASAKGQNSAQLSVTVGTADKNHILYRTCSTSGCSYSGVAGIKCKACNKYDYLVGVKVDLYGSDLGTAGAERVTGTKTTFQYTCLLCKATSSYTTTSVSFYHPYAGGNRSCAENIGYLACRGCNIEGYWGNLRI